MLHSLVSIHCHIIRIAVCFSAIDDLQVYEVLFRKCHILLNFQGKVTEIAVLIIRKVQLQYINCLYIELFRFHHSMFNKEAPLERQSCEWRSHE